MQLASVLGTAFINTLKPLVAALNKALASIIEFAVKVVNALGKIFGWKATVSNAGIADDFSDAASGAEDLADNTGTAAKNAKKLKDHLLSIDELNVVQPDTDSSGSGGSGSGSGASGGGGINNEDAFQIEETENPFKSSIKDLEGLGESIRDALMKSMDSIEWDKVYAKAKGFGKGLAQFLNGLFAADKDGNTVFGSIGKTIAGALNSLIYSVFSFSEEFKWADFGKALKNGIQSFINTADLATAGYTVGNLVKGISTAIYEAVKDKQTWKDLGKKIADGINGFLKSMNEVDPSTGKNGWQITADMFNSLVDAVKEAIKSAISNIKWSDIINGIKDFLGELELDTVVAAIGAFVLKHNGIKLTGKVLGTILTSMLRSIASSAGLTVGGMTTGIAALTIEVLLVTKTFKKDFQEWSENIKNYGWDRGRKKTAEENQANPYKNGTAFVQEDGGTWFQEWQEKNRKAKEESEKYWQEAADDISKKMKDWFDKIKPYFSLETWQEFGSNIKNSIVTSITNTVSDWQTSISAWWENDVSTYFEDSKWQTFKDLIDGKIKLSDAISQWKTDVSSWWESHVSNYFTNEKWKKFKDLIDGKIKISDAVESWKTSISAWWDNNVSSYFTDDKWKVFKDLIDGKISISDAVSVWKTNISDWWRDNVSAWFKKKKWDDMLETIPDAFKSAFKAAANGAIGALNKVIGGVESMVNKAVSGLNTLISGINKMPGISISTLDSVTLPRIPEFRSGGFPEDGLFYANHTELVGSFSNGKTAVANNEQIIAGIEEAAYRGFSRAYSENNREASLLEELIVAVREGKEITVDGRSLVSAYDARKARNGFSFT